MTKGKRVLVTGASGYIGSHTIVELIKSGYDVVGVDNFSNSSPDVLNGIESIVGGKVPFMEADCSSKKSLSEVFKQYDDIRAAIHFAAYKAVGESVAEPLKYYGNNILSLVNLLDFMRKQGDSAVVFSSSCTVYGEPAAENLPVSESAPILPAASPYGRTKQICEDILRDAVFAYPSLKAISLRYFNPIGAHPSAKIGELPIGIPQNLVPYITQTAAGLRKELNIWGNDYNTYDGTCIRDYIYVCDLAKAHVASIDRLFSDISIPDFDIFNLGTGTGVSVLQLVTEFIKATGVNVPYRFAERRSGDIEKVWANPQKANELLKWKADTPLSQVLISAWEWEKKVRSIGSL